MPEKYTNYRAEVGVRLRIAREALDMDQEQLGDILGVGPNAVSQYEKGRRLLNPELAARLLKERGVTLDYLFAGEVRGLDRDLYDKISRPQPLVEPAKRGRKGVAA